MALVKGPRSDMIVTVSRIQDHCHEKRRAPSMDSIDLSKAFVKVIKNGFLESFVSWDAFQNQ